MSYSKGVLIHNFNEDQYGLDLQTLPRPPVVPAAAVSHLVHNWKTPVPDTDRAEPAATQHLDAHLFFGHSGDMRDPHTSLQKKEFTTAHAYFMRDPAHVEGVGALTADKFTSADRTPVEPSVLAMKARSSWGDRRQTHSLHPNERFLTEQRRRYTSAAEQGGLKSEDRLPRHYHEFTKSYDKVTFGRTEGAAGMRTIRRVGSLVLA
eukprot:TRINITY_DN10721_c0_g1_i1.p1 TRINITY_DN10721_c0_g1~~TRINITY_DN10721_c0_g1_i1.p1  ORF type:complete len:206 (+),score=42.04 TRINITY_DN10721_c0_g1_i1:85-702(+)